MDVAMHITDRAVSRANTTEEDHPDTTKTIEGGMTTAATTTGETTTAATITDAKIIAETTIAHMKIAAHIMTIEGQEVDHLVLRDITVIGDKEYESSDPTLTTDSIKKFCIFNTLLNYYGKYTFSRSLKYWAK
jgi:hypothetical protein